ncbi:uncharacterized protein C8R40DRAFT_1165123 [Lentinula edodes]|uniref:uncharacterized protein n=1 Tax=Lentinula edodes TaxID=5353 RepID=UPI001E8CE837|nr:uncharacterized protein C8R40DRAFT_1165123 [Lentinula edodes]KAH7880217.1 hypothetical protein C8R40DRAFT_1165123 [Lentinula edodes]KAJ3912632.1 hypothetical protein F5877DRAFT_84611 [Lentinula edodes]
MNIPPGVEPGSSPHAPPLSSLSSSSSSYSSYSSYSYASTSSPLMRSTSSNVFLPGLQSSYNIVSYIAFYLPSFFSHPNSKPYQMLIGVNSSHLVSFRLLVQPREAAEISRVHSNLILLKVHEKAGQLKEESEIFVNGGFDLSDQRRSGGVSPVALLSSTNSSHLNNNGYGYGAGYDPDKSYIRRGNGRLTDVREFALDTGLDAALQFDLSEFGIIGSGKDRDKDGKEVRGERERTITGVSLGKNLKKKEKLTACSFLPLLSPFALSPPSSL